jgi:outer membrane protein assembly factor BamD
MLQESPRTMGFHRFTVPLFIVALLLGGCGLLPEQKDETRDWSAERLWSEAQSNFNEGSYENAIKYLEKLDARYPYGRYEMQTKLNLAYAYYKSEEPESALETLDRFIQLYPTSSAIAYAYYLRGIVNFTSTLGFIARFVPTDTSQRDPGAAADAYNDFMEVIRRFPDTEYAKDSRKRVIYLRNNLAKGEVHVAEYYMERGAYLAAARRAGYVVQNYQRTPAVTEALAIMVDAYTRLGMTELADDAQRVLTLNLERGNLVPESVDDDEESWLEKTWKYLELDEG